LEEQAFETGLDQFGLLIESSLEGLAKRVQLAVDPLGLFEQGPEVDFFSHRRIPSELY
jgi:hypothetical protein